MLQSLVASEEISEVLNFSVFLFILTDVFVFLLDHRYIDSEDLLRFLSKEEVDIVLPLFEGAIETGKIKKSAFRNWVVITNFSYLRLECFN